MNSLCEGPLEKIVIVSRNSANRTEAHLPVAGSDTIRVEFDEEIVAMRVGPENGAAKACSGLDEWI